MLEGSQFVSLCNTGAVVVVALRVKLVVPVNPKLSQCRGWLLKLAVLLNPKQ